MMSFADGVRKSAPWLLLGGVLLAPLLLQPRAIPDGAVFPAEPLVVITPHNETIRYEFGAAFERYYRSQTGHRARIDWRTPGGTSEIARYLSAAYLSSFQDHWTRHLGRPWSAAVAASFDNPKVAPRGKLSPDSLEQQARRAFLDSSAGCGIDLFFGGGAFDFEQQARAGRLVDCGVVREHPALFGPGGIPAQVSGEPYWDPQGRWIGTVISSFGIVYNTDSLRRLGFSEAPAQWAALADPRLRRQVALANPQQSGSVNKAFEMLVQQQLGEAVGGRLLDREAEQAALGRGWTRAMQLLMKIGANARYFTDASTKVALDVEAGEAAAGMTIDFYGRAESERVRQAGGGSRVQYVNIAGGSSVSVDPIGLLRGAPHPDLARAFIAFVLTPEAQRLWNWKVGAPGGPERYALRRMPILPQLYAPALASLRSDPHENPYELARSFTCREEWTGGLFRPLAFIIRIMCIDPHEELCTAWDALIAAHFPPSAMAAFEEVSAVSYAAAAGRIREALGGDKIREVQLARELSEHFRAQYRRAAELARASH